MLVLIAFGAALLVSGVVAPLVARGARRAGLVGLPTEARHIHTRAVPRFGGVAVYAGTCTAVVLALLAQLARGGAPAGARQDFFLSLLIGGTVLFLTGLVDDASGMRASTKLGLQVVAASATYLVGQRITGVSFGPGTTLALGWLSFPLTVLWVVGVTNAFNLIDGLDGLAAGIGLVVLATVAAAATLLGNADVVLVCVALLGALLGFLRYNLTPARLFLGDSGSLFVGFLLAMLSLHGSLKSATTVVIVVPVFALAVPLLDVALAVLRRWLRGSPIFSADARHLHHRLLAAGLAPSRAAVVLCAAAAAFAVCGLSVAFAPPPAVLAVSLVGGMGALAFVLFGVRRLDYHEFTEAGAALFGGVRRVRRVVRDQINARETALLVPRVPSVVALNRMLAARAGEFGFVRMEVGREHDLAASGRPARGAHPAEGGPEGGAVRMWRLDFPVAPAGADDEDAFILRISGDREHGYRPFAAERVVRVVGPAVEEWLRVRVTGALEAPEPEVARGPAERAHGERTLRPAVVRDGRGPGEYDRWRPAPGAPGAVERRGPHSEALPAAG